MCQRTTRMISLNHLGFDAIGHPMAELPAGACAFVSGRLALHAYQAYVWSGSWEGYSQRIKRQPRITGGFQDLGRATKLILISPIPPGTSRFMSVSLSSVRRCLLRPLYLDLVRGLSTLLIKCIRAFQSKVEIKMRTGKDGHLLCTYLAMQKFRPMTI